MLHILHPAIVTPGANPPLAPAAVDHSYNAWLPSTNPGIRMRPDSADRTRAPLERPMSATARRAVAESDRKHPAYGAARPASSVGFRKTGLHGDERGWMQSPDAKLSLLVHRQKRPATALGIRQEDKHKDDDDDGSQLLGHARPPRPPSADVQSRSSHWPNFSNSMEFSPPRSSMQTPFTNSMSRSSSKIFRVNRMAEMPVPLMILLASKNLDAKASMRRPESAGSALPGKGHEKKGRNRRQERWRNAQRNFTEKRLNLSCVPPAAFLQAGMKNSQNPKETEDMSKLISQICSTSQEPHNVYRRPERSKPQETKPKASKARPNQERVRSRQTPMQNANMSSESIRQPTQANRTVFQRKIDERIEAFREDPDKRQVLHDRIEWQRAEFRNLHRSIPYMRSNMRSASRWRETRIEVKEEEVRRREELHSAARERRLALERHRNEKLGGAEELVRTKTVPSRAPSSAKLDCRTSDSGCVKGVPAVELSGAKGVRQGAACLGQAGNEEPPESIVTGMTADFAEMNAKILEIYAAREGMEGSVEQLSQIEEGSASDLGGQPSPTAGGSPAQVPEEGGLFAEHSQGSEGELCFSGASEGVGKADGSTLGAGSLTHAS